MSFSMKNISAQVLLCLSIAAMSSHVMAADSTINIDGQVIADGCSISGNDLNVTLPDVDASDLATTGSKSEDKDFTITFANCSSAVEVVSLNYGSAGGDTAPGQSNYWANVGTATNVNFDLRRITSSGTERAASPGTQGVILNVDEVTHSLAVPFRVNIRNNGAGAATPGTVIGNVSLTYTYG